MNATMRQIDVTSPDKALVNVRGSMAKAELHDNGELAQLSSVVKEAAKRAHGKQGVAAAVLKKDEGNFARDIAAGRMTLREMAALGRPFLAALGKDLYEQNAELMTPLQHYQSLIRRRAEIDSELDQFTASLIA